MGSQSQFCMRHRYFSESSRLLYGISVKASLLQKPAAVNDRLEVLSAPEWELRVQARCWSVKSTTNNFQN